MLLDLTNGIFIKGSQISTDTYIFLKSTTYRIDIEEKPPHDTHDQ